jgi:hypothetical protein
MDPYLENPAIWPDLHHRLIHEASNLLSEQVLPKYVVRVDLRVYVSDERDPGRDVIIPDIRVMPGGATSGSIRLASAAAPTVEDVAEPVEATILIEEEIREARLIVREVATREVVTVIEVLSPTNKVPGARGWDNYGNKRSEVLASPSHLVEIDLLRSGLRYGPRERLPPFDYLVNVSRAARRPKATLWPIRMTQRLPVVPVPLLAGDPDAKLDLQASLNAAYDHAGYAYDDAVNYAAEPVPAFTPEQREWADRLLREKGLR